MKNNWTIEEITKLYDKPFLELVYEAATVHRQNHNPREVQISTLLSVKTGGCHEDCSYCSQSSRYNTGLKSSMMYDMENVVGTAKKAKEAGATRFCMGAAQREVKNNKEFSTILEMVSMINDLGMEVCCTLGMLTYEQAKQLADAGLHTYNHNIDTSREYYSNVISTRTFDDRLATLENVRKANLKVCCGGIVGMGESKEDKIRMIHTLATLPKYPESVPINALVPIEGTPFEDLPRITVWEFVRVIALARITMPKAIVRLSAGRLEMGIIEQAFCFLAGANSIFSGDKLLTTPNPSFDEDIQMFDLLGLVPKQLHQKAETK
jgi:biotin synthase